MTELMWGVFFFYEGERGALRTGSAKKRGGVGSEGEREGGRKGGRGEIDRRRSRENRKRKMEGEQGPFKWEQNKCSQQVLLMAAAEDSSQNPKVRPVQVPEY